MTPRSGPTSCQPSAQGPLTTAIGSLIRLVHTQVKIRKVVWGQFLSPATHAVQAKLAPSNTCNTEDPAQPK
jgi:hypothetical protein